MKKIRILASLYICFGLMACGTPNSGSNNPSALPKDTKDQIRQNLQNGVIPSPTDVNNNNVPAAKNLCETFISELPKNWFYEKIEVPEDPSNPDGRKIKVFYYGKINPNSTPTIFFNGGPGSASHGSYYGLMSKQKNFDANKKISFIFIDQRGNGCSDFYPQGKSPEVLERLSHYGSKGIVSDAEYVRKKILQDKKWNVFGQSYGGHIVHRYMIQAPHGVNAAFSHANILQSDGYLRIKNRIASQARVYKMYLKRFPEDEQKIIVLKNFLTL